MVDQIVSTVVLLLDYRNHRVAVPTAKGTTAISALIDSTHTRGFHLGKALIKTRPVYRRCRLCKSRVHCPRIDGHNFPRRLSSMDGKDRRMTFPLPVLGMESTK